MKAVVMAGGEGSRLRPLTVSRPKPMAPIVGRPVMEHILNLLKRHGINDVVVTVQYMASAIEDYFGDGSQFGMRISYSREETPLGTAGSVK
ncbi:MAG TPA: nucleotidyltransferase family protein, partial [Ktedonobacterales bacterium]|nr:nucleotidyltransferase family protein [Ktedonobacterales bacterium]